MSDHSNKNKHQQKLLRSGACGFMGTLGFFSAGLITGIADGYNEITTGVVNNADALSRATDTLMTAGCMTGLFTAAVGTVYFNRRDQGRDNDYNGPN